MRTSHAGGRRAGLGLPWPLVACALGCLDAGGDPAVERGCSLGITEASAFREVETGGVFVMTGSGQGSLTVRLAVRTDDVVNVDEVRLELTVTSALGEAQSHYERGGLSPGCDAGCDFLFLNTSTRELVEDPLDLRDLPVTVSATLLLSGEPFCTVTQSGRLLRAQDGSG